MHMSNARLAVDEGSLLWTLEEISRLVSQNGNPSETLGNVVHLIQRRFATDVCSVYLLEADRASLVLAATIGLRPESVGRVRMRLTEGLAGLVAEELQPQVVADATTHPRFKYFRGDGRGSLPIVPRRPDRRSRSAAGRADRPDHRAARVQPRRCADAGDGRGAAGADRQSRPARSDRSSRRRTSACSTRAEPVVELGQRDDQPVPRAGPGALARAAATIRSRCSSGFPIDTLEERALAAGAAQPDQLRLSADAGIPERRRIPGARGTPACCGRGRSAYFSAEFGLHESLPIYSGGLGILAGDHVKSASDLGIPLVGVGLYYDQGYFRQRLDLRRLAARGLPRRRQSRCCRFEPAIARRRAR